MSAEAPDQLRPIVDRGSLREGDIVHVRGTVFRGGGLGQGELCIGYGGAAVHRVNSCVDIVRIERRPIAVGNEVKHHPTGLTVTVEAIKGDYAFVFPESDITGPFVSRLEWREREA